MVAVSNEFALISKSTITPLRLQIIHRLFITLGIWSSLALCAHARSAETSITPDNLDQYGYRFSVSTTASTDGVAFHVTITAKNEDILAVSAANLSMVTHTETPDSSTHSFKPVKPKTPITVKKDKRVCEADFTVSHDLLEKPGICFVFTNFVHATIDGKSVAISSADFHVMKLHEFLKK